ncbi:uncharacterized protein LOC144747603 [Ciona intestinalis]
MKIYDFETQIKKPSRTFLDLFPNYTDNLNRMHSWKLPSLEPHAFPDKSLFELRLQGTAIHCDKQTLAYFMCIRHMSRRASFHLCKTEIEDMQECRIGMQRIARHKKLMKASDKVGDIIPHLNGNMNWTY